MFNRFVSPEGVWPEGIALVRIMAGALIIRYGLEFFSHDAILNIASWLGPDHHFPAPVFMAYVGKFAEFFGGVLLILGLFTRAASLLLVINMTVITFLIRKSLIFGEDEHPFLFLLLFAVFFLTGPGAWSLDQWLSDKRRASAKHNA